MLLAGLVLGGIGLADPPTPERRLIRRWAGRASRPPPTADAADPIAALRSRFEIPDPDLCYLDGNSLGRPPPHGPGRGHQRVLDDWSEHLVVSWERWIDRPLAVGDLLAPVLGAGPGQVLIGESTTVALYQAVDAALSARPDRTVIVVAAGRLPH